MRIHRLFHRLVTGLLWLSLMTAITGLHHALQWPVILSIGLFLGMVACLYFFRSQRLLTVLSLTLFLAMMGVVGSLAPSNDRAWIVAHSVLPEFEQTGRHITIRQFRNFTWRDPARPEEIHWEERTYDLEKLHRLDLVVEPFQDSDFLAHVMLRFHFRDQGNVIVSVEARQEKGETYGLIPGAFRQFELIYIFGSERDLMDLRAVHRGTRLYAFPVKADGRFIRDLFRDLAAAAQALHTRPQFYRSIRDNCTTTLVKHIDRHYPRPIGLRYETLFPALTGRLLYEWGYMDTDLTYNRAKEEFRVDERIRETYKDGQPPPTETGS